MWSISRTIKVTATLRKNSINVAYLLVTYVQEIAVRPRTKPFGLSATVYSWLITQCKSQWSPMTACFFNSAYWITSSISSLVVFSLFCNKYLSPAVTPQLSDLDKLQENGLPLEGLRFSQYSLRALCSNHIKITLWQSLS